ncbi:MAG TPA: ROK family protein [Pseudolysinimonas sp.]|nr:ROK family protein [Pseudolysinimonas sp.]
MPPLVSNLDGVRRGNLSAVLGIVHRHGPVARAWITTETGLNRSTVGVLVAELASLGLVVENSPEATNRVGRPSPSVSPNPDVVAVAVNPEVDAVTVGVVGLGARVEQQSRHDLGHPARPEEVAELVAGAVRRLAPRRIAGIGLAVPGLVREADGVVRWAPHLGWTDAPITALVEQATGIRAFAANDASLGALAERLFGAGRGVDELLYLNGGASGIGGGVIAGGRAIGGRGGYAGEFGQTRPGFSDPGDRRTANGTLEDEVSRERLLAAVGRASATEPELAGALLDSTDPRVAAELARQRRVLAVALGNAVDLLNPEAVVLGGYLATLFTSAPLEFEREVAAQTVSAAWEGTRIVGAELGDRRLMVGAAELAFAPLLADPAAARLELQRG